MNNLDEIAQEIMRLEDECQKGINVKKNLQKMEALMLDLPFDKLLELNSKLENFLTN